MVAAFPESKKECEAVKSVCQSGRYPRVLQTRSYLCLGRGVLDAQPDGMLYVGAHDVVAAYYF